MSLPVALLQLTSNANVADNLTTIKSYLDELFSAHSPRFVLLPENAFSFGFRAEEILNTAEVYQDGLIQQTVAKWATDYHTSIAIGSIYLKKGANSVTKSLLIYNQQGLCVARYDKMHLFDVQLKNGERHLESEVIVRGHSPVTVRLPFASFGLSICYDLRFPELYQHLRELGAQILLVPAAFTAFTGKAHWLPLLRSRAIETQCFVLAANQWGTHENGRETFGHSTVINPWGEILALQESGCGSLLATLDLTEIQRCIDQIPCFEHKNGYFSHE